MEAKAEGRRQKAEGRRQKAEGRRQKAEGRRQKAEGTARGFLPSTFYILPSSVSEADRERRRRGSASSAR
ncbi:MAG: hypothetical protein DMF86_24680 [Acidobacteria bacterium]|nr:MAG: hypothetical protein DMF86_24680 [Acidobacteriota bacterium]